MKRNRRNYLWLAFQDGQQFRLEGTDRLVTMRSDDAGSITLPTGKIVVCDPDLATSSRPFTTTVPPDTYSVHLALGDDDVALVMVFFRERRIRFVRFWRCW